MKITRISLEGFRAFDEPFEIDLADGRNLLLHGENGSGKSSIYLALKRFFEERGDDITAYRNHFSPVTRSSTVRLHLKGADSANNQHDRDFHWDLLDGHPLPVPKNANIPGISSAERSLLVDGARRSGFLDYRMMLRTHLLASSLSRTNRGPKIHQIVYGVEERKLGAQLFDVVTLAILAGVRVTTAGGSPNTLGGLMRRVWENRPANRYASELRTANAMTNTFSQAFNAKLPELEFKLNEYLNYFENHQLSIKLPPVSLAWDKASLELKGAELAPEISFRGKVVIDHHQFLNEARLSAIATCLFLAGVHLSDNDYGNPAYPRFLVLDDSLIGLDLQNRLPVLSILSGDAFKNYQKFVLTHDRVWFDLACGHLREKDGWLHMELLADESAGALIPRGVPSLSDLDRAKRHLTNSDLRAAAVYARAAFEWKLRNVCERNGVKVAFRSDPDKIGSGALWDAIVLRQRDREDQRAKGAQIVDFVPPALEAAVEVMRSTVLNKLSHAGAHGLVKSEVATAITTVEQVCGHPFPKS